MSGYIGGGVQDHTFIAGASMKTSTSQYAPVYLSAGNTVNLATASTDLVIGVNMSYLSASSESCNVRLQGIAKCYCNASVTVGQPVGAAALTKIANVTIAGITTTAFYGVLGFAMESGSTNQAISVFVQPHVER